MSEGHRPVRLTKREISKADRCIDLSTGRINRHEVKAEPQDYRTYAEWQKLGRHVVKGQKSVRRDAKGQPVFSMDQTAEQTLFETDEKGRAYYIDDSCPSPHLRGRSGDHDDTEFDALTPFDMGYDGDG